MVCRYSLTSSLQNTPLEDKKKLGKSETEKMQSFWFVLFKLNSWAKM
jgi:hypothetical protein